MSNYKYDSIAPCCIPIKCLRSVTRNSMNANNLDETEINVTIDGTKIPLPNHPYLDSFVADENNTTFTVPETGIYFITYDIKLTDEYVMTSKLLRNDEAIPESIVTPILANDNFRISFMQKLNVGDILSLEVYGTQDVKLQPGNGAALNIIRIV